MTLAEGDMATFIGDDLTARDEAGQLKVRIATVFPRAGTIVTWPCTHFEQRLAYIASVDRARHEQCKPPLTEAEQDAEMEASVDLLLDEQSILIRPDPSRMDLALEADELLQDAAPDRRIQYLFLSDRRVRESLKRRGECWRIFLPPTDPKKIAQLIAESRSAIEGKPIYYYSATTGTRLLTYDKFARLGELDDAELRKHLAEIAAYTARSNRTGHREIQFFMAGKGIDSADLESAANCSGEELRARFAALRERLGRAVPAEYQVDDLEDAAWRKRMFDLLITQGDEGLMDEQAMGLDPDFSMRVEWLPGGRFEEGELIMHPATEGPYGTAREKQVLPMVRTLILNLVQEYGDLEYINLGSVLPSPKRNEQRSGRREVFVAQIKQRRAMAEVLQIIRMQKWGVRERLDNGDSLEDAMNRSEDYTEYVLDRRLACGQLGMNLPHRQIARKVSEIYDGTNLRYRGVRIWTPYFQRDYIVGIATNQVPARKLADDAYAIIFARLLGQAAASNIILGRAELTGEVVFDVGDEIVVEDRMGMPAEIVLSDHVGTFVDWTGSLESRAAAYAAPVTRCLGMVTHGQEFADAYLSGFVERFIRIQEEYAKHRRAFDTLFKFRPFDSAGSLACRWASVLGRLRGANPRALSDLIRAAIRRAK